MRREDEVGRAFQFILCDMDPSTHISRDGATFSGIPWSPLRGSHAQIILFSNFVLIIFQIILLMHVCGQKILHEWMNHFNRNYNFINRTHHNVFVCENNAQIAHWIFIFFKSKLLFYFCLRFYEFDCIKWK